MFLKVLLLLSLLFTACLPKAAMQKEKLSSCERKKTEVHFYSDVNPFNALFIINQ